MALHSPDRRQPHNPLHQGGAHQCHSQHGSPPKGYWMCSKSGPCLQTWRSRSLHSPWRLQRWKCWSIHHDPGVLEADPSGREWQQVVCQTQWVHRSACHSREPLSLIGCLCGLRGKYGPRRWRTDRCRHGDLAGGRHHNPPCGNCHKPDQLSDSQTPGLHDRSDPKRSPPSPLLTSHLLPWRTHWRSPIGSLQGRSIWEKGHALMKSGPQTCATHCDNCFWTRCILQCCHFWRRDNHRTT